LSKLSSMSFARKPRPANGIERAILSASASKRSVLPNAVMIASPKRKQAPAKAKKSQANRPKNHLSADVMEPFINHPSTGDTSPAPLEQEGDEAASAAHVLFVRLAEAGDERGFLNVYAIGIGNACAKENRDQRCPIAERQTYADESDESAGVRRMADVAIRSGVDDCLAGLDGNFVGERASEDAHGVKAKG
jgi:hypothetical protein